MHADAGRDSKLLAVTLAPIGLWLAWRRFDVVQATAVRADRFAMPAGIFKPCVATAFVPEHPVELRDAQGLCDSFLAHLRISRSLLIIICPMK